MRNYLITFVTFSILAACVPPSTTGGAGAPATAAAEPASGAHQKRPPVPLRGRVPKGKKVDRVVAVEVGAKGHKPKRIHITPAADGSFAMKLPRGRKYAVEFERGGKRVGELSFPKHKGSKPSRVLNISSNVNVKQSYIDVGTVNGVDGGDYAAEIDPLTEMDSDGDGVDDYDDPDVDNDGVADADDQDSDGDGISDADEEAEAESEQAEADDESTDTTDEPDDDSAEQPS